MVTIIKRKVRELHMYIPEETMERIDYYIEQSPHRTMTKAITYILNEYCDMKDKETIHRVGESLHEPIETESE